MMKPTGARWITAISLVLACAVPTWSQFAVDVNFREGGPPHEPGEHGGAPEHQQSASSQSRGPREIAALLLVTDVQEFERLVIRIEREFGLQRRADYVLGSFNGFHLTVFRILGEQSAAAIAGRLNRIENVVADRNDEIPVAADPYGPRQYALQVVGANRVHSALRGRNVIVGIVDTGVDVNHPDLRGAFKAAENVIEGASGITPDLHGTAVAGLIGARGTTSMSIIGMAPAAQLVAIQACDVRGAVETCAVHRVVRGIDRAVALGARIVNLSLAGQFNAVLSRMILQVIYVHNVVVVSAAGNNGPDGPPLYPAAIPGVVAVGATDSHDRVYTRTNRGAYVSILAPGVEVLATQPRNGRGAQTGTSIAAPYVSGAIALLMEADGSIPPDQIVQGLYRAAVPTPWPGVGRIDVCRTLALFGKPGLCN
jgi:subtilisin family serine protease